MKCETRSVVILQTSYFTLQTSVCPEQGSNLQTLGFKAESLCQLAYLGVLKK